MTEKTLAIDAESAQEARDEAEMELEDAMPEVQILMISSVTIEAGEDGA